LPACRVAHLADHLEHIEQFVVATQVPGEVIVALGRLAAVGETRHNATRSAYFLAEKVETISEASELDSARLRELYNLAKSGSREKAKGGGLPFLP
jgi:predicted nucleic acid-binding protein